MHFRSISVSEASETFPLDISRVALAQVAFRVTNAEFSVTDWNFYASLTEIHMCSRYVRECNSEESTALNAAMNFASISHLCRLRYLAVKLMLQTHL